MSRMFQILGRSRAVRALAALSLFVPALASAQDAGAPTATEAGDAGSAEVDAAAPPAAVAIEAAPPVATAAPAPVAMGPLAPNDPTAVPKDAPTMWIDRNLSKSWELGGNRPFFSTLVDIGYLYGRPRFQLGYGKPFYKFVAIEANPNFSNNYVGGYGGIRAEIPHFDIRFGVRQTYSFQRSTVDRKVELDRYDLESTVHPRSNLTTVESELNFNIPAGPGTVLGLASGSYVLGIPAGQLAYEETLRVMVQAPWVFRERLAYVFGFGEHKQASIGPAIDILEVPSRHSFVLRAGVVGRFVLSRSFELRASFVPRVLSQDELGLLESDFTELGLRWRWATASH